MSKVPFISNDEHNPIATFSKVIWTTPLLWWCCLTQSSPNMLGSTMVHFQTHLTPLLETLNILNVPNTRSTRLNLAKPFSLCFCIILIYLFLLNILVFSICLLFSFDRLTFKFFFKSRPFWFTSWHKPFLEIDHIV